MGMIEGVEIKELTTYSDQRGYFREILRRTDPIFPEGFGQLSHSLMYPGVAKAWHFHQTQVDWWYVPVGVLKVVLYDLRPDSPTRGERMELLMGEHQPTIVLKIPPGVAHGCKSLSGISHLFYVTSTTFDPAEEGRLPHDDPTIGYDWTAPTPIT